MHTKKRCIIPLGVVPEALVDDGKLEAEEEEDLSPDRLLPYYSNRRALI
jgi:hypothetical protein